MVERKVAVVLSGGGAKGAYEAGVLRAIAKQGISIQVMTGASIGAINAAVFAWEYECTGNMLHAADTVCQTWLELSDVFKISFWHVLWQAFLSLCKTGSPLNLPSFVDNSKIKSKLVELIPRDLRISDLKSLELVINATCLTEGKSVSFTRNNDAYLYDAILASSAIPLVLESQIINGRFYVDGGVFNNTPLRDALKARATDVFVVELRPKTKAEYFETIGDFSDFSGVYKVGTRLVELIMDKIMYEDLKQAKRINEIIAIIKAVEDVRGQAELVSRLKKAIGYEKDGDIKRYVNFYEIAPKVRLEPPGTMGFGQTEAIKELIQLGERDAEEQLKDIQPTWEKQFNARNSFHVAN